MNGLRRLLAYRPKLLTRVAIALALVSLVPLGFLAWRMLGLTESATVESKRRDVPSGTGWRGRGDRR